MDQTHFSSIHKTSHHFPMELVVCIKLQHWVQFKSIITCLTNFLSLALPFNPTIPQLKVWAHHQL